MEPRLKILLSLSALVFLGADRWKVSAGTCEFPAVFNFGDSNSDTGGLSAAFGQAGPPAGETYFGAPAGRYSDGRLIIDFIGTVFHYRSLHLLAITVEIFKSFPVRNVKVSF